MSPSVPTTHDASGERSSAEPDAPLAPELSAPRSLNIPNIITLARLGLAIVILVLIDAGVGWTACAVVFVIAVATDFIDGYLARKWNQVTPLGRMLDPFVDKIVIGGTMIFLTRLPESGITPWMTFIVIGREMFITALRSVLEAHGVDFSARTSGKLKMLIQSTAIPVALLSLSPRIQRVLGSGFETFLSLRTMLLWGMVILTLYSGAEYLWRGWQLLHAPPPDECNDP